MAYQKKPSPQARMLERIGCPICWITAPDADFCCAIPNCPRIAVPIVARRDEWEGLREPESAK